MSARLQPDELIRLLSASGFEFVLIGGLAAIAHGAETPTKDFDVTAPFSEGNLGRLLKALKGHDLRFALTVDKRPVVQEPAELAQFNNLYFDTDLGRLDILKIVDPLGPFEAVAPRAPAIDLFDRQIRVLSLDDLITVKSHLGRPKDKQVELELRAIRDKLRSSE